MSNFTYNKNTTPKTITFTKSKQQQTYVEIFLTDEEYQELKKLSGESDYSVEGLILDLIQNHINNS